MIFQSPLWGGLLLGVLALLPMCTEIVNLGELSNYCFCCRDWERKKQEEENDVLY